MLEFSHCSAEKENSGKYHPWPFVYFHGRAETMNYKAFEAGGDAPDISIANEPIEKYYPRGTSCDVAITCMVAGEPAVVVLSNRQSGLLRGRIVLVNDIEAARHAYTPEEWR